MKRILVALLLSCSRNETLDEAVLVPGQSLGPIKLGATRADVDASGLVVRIDPSGQGGDQVNFAGPFTVIFDAAGHVDSVAIDLNKVRRGVHVGPALVPPDATLESATTALGPCEFPQPYDGGVAVSCQGGRLRIERSENEHAPLRLRVLAPMRTPPL